MFCKYCGKDLGDSKNDICADCMEKQEITDEKINNETVTEKEQETKKEEPAKEPEVLDVNGNSNANSNTNNNYSAPKAQTKQKSKIAAGLFGIFLGAFGVHNFYLGNEGKGIAQVLITVLSCFTLSFVSAIWGLVEGILILTGEIDKDGDGNPLRTD